MEEKLRLRYIEGTRTIVQVLDYIHGYFIVVVYNTQGDCINLICEKII